MRRTLLGEHQSSEPNSAADVLQVSQSRVPPCWCGTPPSPPPHPPCRTCILLFFCRVFLSFLAYCFFSSFPLLPSLYHSSPFWLSCGNLEYERVGHRSVAAIVPFPSLYWDTAFLHYCWRMLQVGAIVPWNYPFHNIFNPLTATLFAGNALVLKV